MGGYLNISFNDKSEINDSFLEPYKNINDCDKSNITKIVKGVLNENPKLDIMRIDINRTEKNIYVRLQTKNGYSFTVKNPELTEIAAQTLLRENRSYSSIRVQIKPPPATAAVEFPKLSNGNMPKVSPRILAHIHADEFGKSSQLEGSKGLESLAYFTSFVNGLSSEELQKYGLDREKIAVLESSLELNTQLHDADGPDHFKKALAEKREILICGGWIGKPQGHAIYYQIFPEENGLSTIRIFNLGRGGESHFTAQVGGKIKSYPIVEWRGIDRTRLASKEFIQVLKELKDEDAYKYFSSLGAQVRFQEKDIYEGMQKLLNPKEVKLVPEDMADLYLMTPQRSGFCSWKGLMAFMRSKMQEGDYKRLKAHIKMQSLVNYVEQRKSENTPIDLVEWRLVQKSLRKLSRSLIKLKEQNIIDEAYLVKAKEALVPVNSWVKANKKVCFQVEESSKSPEFNFERPAFDSAALPNTKENLFTETASSAGHVDLHALTEEIQRVDLSNPQEIQVKLDKVQESVEAAWNKGLDYEVYVSLKHLLGNLTLDREFWEKAVGDNPKAGEHLVERLGSLQQLLLKSYLCSDCADTRQMDGIFSSLKVSYVQNMVCKAFLKDLWSGVKPYDEMFEGHTLVFRKNRFFERKSFNFHNFDFQKDDEYLFLLNWLKEEPPIPLNHGDVSDYRKEPVGTEKFHTKHCLQFSSSDNKKNIVDVLCDIEPKIREEFAKKIPGFAGKAPHQQNAILFSSPDLPNWFKAVRDGLFIAQHMAYDTIVKVKPNNRQEDLKPAYKTRQYSQDDTLVYYSPVSLIADEEDSKSNYPDYESDTVNTYNYKFTSYTTESEAQIAHTAKLHILSASRGMIMSAFLQRPDVEEFKQLANALVSHKLEPIGLKEFIEDNSEKLADPNRQQLLQRLFFEIGALKSCLSLTGFKEEMMETLRKQVEKSIETNHLQEAVFFLRMTRYFARYTDEKQHEGQLPALRRLLKMQGLSIDEKSYIYQEMAAALGEKQTLNSTEIEELLSASAFHNSNPVPLLWQNSYLSNEFNEAILKHAAVIKEHLFVEGRPNQSLLNNIMRAVMPDKGPVEWTLDSKPEEYPVFKSSDGTLYFDPAGGRVVQIGKPVPLPHSIRHDTTFQRLFPDIQEALPIGLNTFAFKDKTGIETRISLGAYDAVIQKKQLVVQQLIEPLESDFLKMEKGRPLQYIEPNRMIRIANDVYCSLSNLHLLNSYHAWQASDNYIVLRDPQTGKIEYSAALDDLGEVEYLVNLEDKLILGKPSKLFTRIENENYILAWYGLEKTQDGHGIQQEKPIAVEFPRFGLTFKAARDATGRLECSQLPGFFLAPNAVIPALGAYRDYLVLEDAKGNQKALVPERKFLLPKTPEVFKPHYEFDSQEKTFDVVPQKFYVYDIKNDKMKSKSRAANLYAAELQLLVLNYKQAGALLRSFGPKLEPYTREERDLLERIATLDQANTDMDGNAVALRLYACYLLQSNNMKHPKEAKALPKNLKGAFSDYLSHYRNAVLFKLKPSEELLLIKSMKNDDPIIQNRYVELTNGVVYPREPQKEVLPRRSAQLHLNPFAIKQAASRYDPQSDISNHLLSRMFYPSFSINLIRAYEIALSGSQKDKEYLRHGLLMARGYADEAPSPAFLRILENVLANPDKFPKLPENLRAEIDGWLEEVLEINERIGETSSENSSFEIHEEHDFTPAGFKFDRERPAIEDFRVEVRRPSLDESRMTALLLRDKDKWIVKADNPGAEALSGKADKSATPIPSKTTSGAEQSLEEFFKTASPGDPIEKNEFDRLAGDNAEFLKIPLGPKYQISDDSLREMKKEFESIGSANAAQMTALASEILSIARKDPDTDVSKAEAILLKWGGEYQPLKLGELIVNFAVQNPAALVQRNPGLKKSDIETIYAKISEYLLLATEAQQASRALDIIEKIDLTGGDGQDSDDLKQLLAGEILGKRCYDPVQKPVFLVFEYFSDLMIREKQVSMIEDFINKKNENLVMEMIMGSGKSTILLPLLGLLRADGKSLSLLLVPDPLFSSVSGDLQAILRDAFGTSLHTLHFERDTPTDLGTLDSILTELEEVIVNKECLILSSKSVSCLVLKYVEMAMAHHRRHGAEAVSNPALDKMRQILEVLSKNGTPLLDEADQLLNSLKEVSFSAGNAKPPEEEEMDIVAAIYEILYTDPSIKSQVQFECDPQPNPSVPILTAQNFQEKIKTPLIRAMGAKFKDITLSNRDLQAQCRSFFRNLSPKDQELLEYYLNRDDQHIAEAQKYYRGLPAPIKKILALAGEEINRHLLLTLNQHCDEKYGVDTEMYGILGMPFSSANKPTRGSQFINHHITMNYTIQTHMKKGIPKNILKTVLTNLLKQAQEEIIESGGQKGLFETYAGKKFVAMKGDLEIPFVNISDQQIEILLGRINKTPQQKLDFIRNNILPTIEIYPKKISINPINLASFFPTVGGFTGTLWNSRSMHRKISPKPSLGTDALTLNLLWQNSFDKVHALAGSHPSEMMDEIQKIGQSFDMVCDAGGYLKEYSNEENAKQIFLKFQKPVVYFDSRGQIQVWDGKKNTPFSESSLKEEQRITFLDQAHTTGSNILQKRTAMGYVTIGHKMLLRDLLQSVWRLRGLAKSQKVQFLLSKETETIIRQALGLNNQDPISFKEILQFVVRNQAHQQGKENYRAFLQELEDIPQFLLLKTLLNPNSSPENNQAALEKLAGFWEKQTAPDPDVLYGTLAIDVPAEILVKQKAEEMKKLLKENGFAASETDELIDNIAKRYSTVLPPKISVRPEDEEMTMELEQQQERELEIEMEMEQEAYTLHTFDTPGEITPNENGDTRVMDKIDGSLFDEWNKAVKENPKEKYPRATIPMIPLQIYFEQTPGLQKVGQAFAGLNVSLNLFQWDRDKPKVSEMQFFGSNRHRIHYFTTEGSHVSAISLGQGDHLMGKDPDRINSVKSGPLNFDKGKTLRKEPNYLYNIVRLKFLNGESSYSKEELEILRDWLLKNNPETMRNFFVGHVLSGQPTQKDAYLGSPLHRLFTELYKERGRQPTL